ncbi:MAG: hypothetical protein WCS87_14790 [Methylococcaceae bacterium]
MASIKNKLAAKEALKFIHNNLKADLNLIPLDNIGRSKAHGFAVGEYGKQFIIILGDHERAHQTRIITEKLFDLPDIVDVAHVMGIYKGMRVNKQKNTSLGYKNNLFDGNQSSFIVDNLSALDQLIRWYVTSDIEPAL